MWRARPVPGSIGRVTAPRTPGSPVEIAAGRLHLRPWRGADAEQVHEICQDPELQRWTRVPVPYTLDDALHFVNRISPAGWAADTDALFAVLDAADGRLLASVGLMHLDPQDRRAELGYWCAARARGRGVTTEAVQAVCRWGFAERGVHRVEWFAQVGNVASRRVAEKAGFTPEGTARGRLQARAGMVDAWTAALLATDPAAGS